MANKETKPLNWNDEYLKKNLSSMSYIISVLKFGLLWPPEDPSQRKRYLMCTICSEIPLCITIFGAVFSITKQWNSEGVFDNITLVLSFTQIVIRCLRFAFSSSSSKVVVNSLLALFSSEFHDSAAKALMEDTVHFTLKMAKSYTAFVIVTGTLAAIYPFIVKVISQNSGNSSNHLSVDVRYPGIDATESPYFEIFSSIICYGGSYYGVCFGGADAFCITAILLTTCQFRILCNSLRNLPRRLKRNGQRLPMPAEKHEDIQQLENSNTGIHWESKEHLNLELCSTFHSDLKENRAVSENEQLLRNIVKHHQALLAVSEELVAFLSPVFLLDVLVTSVNMCLLCFEISVLPMGPAKMLKTTMHLGVAILGFTLYCYFEARLTQESAAVSNAAYNCEWYNESPQFRSMVKYMIIRAQRPVYLKAGSFATMSLETFVEVIRRNYSFLAIVRQMYKT